MNNIKSWYHIKSQSQGSAVEVHIYDEIGLFGITAKNFVDELKSAASNAAHIDVHLNTPGGSVFDGIAIYNSLKNHPATVTTHIDGLAASAGSLVALAGDTVKMAENAFFMIHNPFGLVMGQADDMRKEAEVLDKLRNAFVNSYVMKTGKLPEEIIEMMDNETWLDSHEAIELGFIDEVTVAHQAAARAGFQSRLIRHYANAPQEIRRSQTDDQPETAQPSEIEKLRGELRSAIDSLSKEVDFLKKKFKETEQVATDVLSSIGAEPVTTPSASRSPTNDDILEEYERLKNGKDRIAFFRKHGDILKSARNRRIST